MVIKHKVSKDLNESKGFKAHPNLFYKFYKFQFDWTMVELFTEFSKRDVQIGLYMILSSA